MYTTVDSRIESERLAHEAIKQKLAACANIIPGVISIYEWEQSIEKTEEHVVLFKTSTERAPELETFLRERHPYTLPCIVNFEGSASAAFYQFVTSTTHR